MKYQRVLLKVSGEALAGERGFGIDDTVVFAVCNSIAAISGMGVEIAVVVGGGNFFRGAKNSSIERVKADYMGMIATVMNALSLADALERIGVKVRVMTALPIAQIAETYDIERAREHLTNGRVVILACGTGHPYFTTDTAAALRATELLCEIVLKATQVDGVYDKDPQKNSDALRFRHLSFTEILAKRLSVIDSTAACICRENGMPMLIFGIDDPRNIIRAATEGGIGTMVSESS